MKGCDVTFPVTYRGAVT